MLERSIERVCRALDQAIGLLLALMVALVFGNVVLRYGFDSGITLSEELARWLFVWMTFLGATVGLARRAHLGTESLTSRLGPKGQRLCARLSGLLMLICCIMVGLGAWRQATINFSSTSAVMQASLAWLDAAVLVFAVIGGLILAARMVHRPRSDAPSLEQAKETRSQ